MAHRVDWVRGSVLLILLILGAASAALTQHWLPPAALAVLACAFMMLRHLTSKAPRSFELIDCDEIIGHPQTTLERVAELERRSEIYWQAARRFEELFSGLPIACFTTDAKGTIYEWNRESEKLWGYPASEVFEQSMFDLLWPEGVSKSVRARLARVFAGRKSDPFEVELKSSRQNRSWVLSSIFPLRDPNGNVVAALCANVDITDRKKWEERLRNSESKFRCLIEHGRDVILTLELDGKITYASPSVKSVLDWEPSDLEGKNVHEYLRKSADADIETLFQNARIDATNLPPTRLAFLHQDGLYRYLECMPSLHRNELGEMVLILNARDVSDRLRMERALRASEERTRNIIDSALDAVITLDENGQIIGWNSAAHEIFGYTREETLGRKLLHLVVPAEERSGHPLDVEALFESQPDFDRVRTEIEVLRKDGERFLIELSLSQSVYGDARFCSAFIRDVTERRNARVAIEQLARFPNENPSPTLRFSTDGKVLYANSASSPLLDTWQVSLGDPLPESFRSEIQSCFVEHKMSQMEFEAQGRVYLLDIVPVEGAGYANVYGSEITERKRAETELRIAASEIRQTKENLQRTLESITDGFFAVDKKWRITYINREARRLLDIAEDVQAGDSIQESVAYLRDTPLMRQLKLAFNSGETVRFETYFEESDSWLDVKAYPSGEGLSVYFHDVSDRKHSEQMQAAQLQQIREYSDQLEKQRHELRQANAKLEEANSRLEALATRDGLTGIFNHRAFQDHLERAATSCARSNRPLSLLMIDVDEFKKYNDAFGHPMGDEVLIGVAKILTEHAREVDIVARYGGEEFAVLLPDADETAALTVAERIRSAIEDREWPLRPVTISLGAATTCGTCANAKDLISEADKALYASKANGRNRTSHFRTIQKEAA